MTKVNDEIRCPMCDELGWTTFGRLDGFAGVCGSFWSANDMDSQSPQCQIIAALKMDNMLLRCGVAA